MDPYNDRDQKGCQGKVSENDADPASYTYCGVVDILRVRIADIMEILLRRKNARHVSQIGRHGQGRIGYGPGIQQESGSDRQEKGREAIRSDLADGARFRRLLRVNATDQHNSQEVEGGYQECQKRDKREEVLAACVRGYL